MSNSVVDAWIENLLQQCARWNIVFIQLGDAFPTTRESIAPRVDSVVEVENYLTDDRSDGAIRLVDNVEKLLAPGAPTLGQLRERVIADRDNGVRVVLLSRKPRIAFPNPPGSEILRDAKMVPPPVYRLDEGAQTDFGFEATQEGTPTDIVIAQALRELGQAACASLDALMFEDGRDSDGLTGMEEPLQEALISSGLIVTEGDKVSWAVKNAESRLRVALSDVISGVRRPPPELARVSEECWAIERLIKQSLRARAKVLWGDDWSAELLGTDFGATVLTRARRGTYPTADVLLDLRDPLEWLSLGEVLDVQARSGVGSLGVHNSMWTKVRAELLPVKDRVERSQLMRKTDIDVAHRWSNLLSERLSLSGSRSIDDSLATAQITQRDLVTRIRRELGENPAFRGDIEKDLMSLVVATVRFLAHVLDDRPAYTAAFSNEGDAPLERALQDSFKGFLDMSDLAGRSAVEVSGVGGGRADVVLYFDDGSRYVTEVKRELKHGARKELEAAYLPQAAAYQSGNVPFGQLLVLDLTSDRQVHEEHLDQSVWVAHDRDTLGTIITSTVVAVVRGNRPSPSKRRS